jgi:hypothetical protein
MIPVCHNCKHYINDLKCSAFPEGIPTDILSGENDHSEPTEDQITDIVYEPTIL